MLCLFYYSIITGFLDCTDRRFGVKSVCVSHRARVHCSTWCEERGSAVHACTCIHIGVCTSAHPETRLQYTKRLSKRVKTLS